MKLYIAEKPSLGRAIAAALSQTLAKPHKNHKTHIELANGDVVSWCVGHILAQADPQDYDVKYKKWTMETLPIVPQQWQLKPITRTRAQLSVLRKLVKQADDIIHAGDPDKVTINSLEIDKSYSSYISTAGKLFTAYKIDSSISIKRLTKTSYIIDISGMFLARLLTTIDNSTREISLTPFKFNIISPSLNFNLSKRMLCA